MAKITCLFLIISLLSTRLSIETTQELIIWNVGQGQWVTLVTDGGCEHFDMGGEFAPWKKIMSLCRAKPNQVSISHWDQDHLSFLASASRWLPRLCIMYPPIGHSANQRKERMVQNLELCTQPISSLATWSGPADMTPNDSSRVLSTGQVLLPGDSPKRQEYKWINQLSGISKTQILILGHHGSQTSTSTKLLDQLTHLRMSVASARRKRYGHPHVTTIRELEKRKIPLLKTEEWGNIHIFL